MPRTPTELNLINIEQHRQVFNEGPLGEHPQSVEAVIKVATATNSNTAALGLITGHTEQEKADAFLFFQGLTKLFKFLHRKRADSTMLLVAVYLLLSILQKAGFPVKDIGYSFIHLMDAITKFLSSTGG